MTSNYSNIPFPMPVGHITGVWDHLQEQYEEMLKEIKQTEDIIVSVFLFCGHEIRVKTFRYAGPNLLIVDGFFNELEVEAYVHQSCLQVIFSKVAKDEKKERNQIGFVAGSPQTSDDPEVQ